MIRALPFIAVIQTILQFLGMAGIILGIVAFVFGNGGRGMELLIGGVLFIALKFVIGIVFTTSLAASMSKTNSPEE